MTRKHLLFWIIDYLSQNHPMILADMTKELKGDKENTWVNAALHERLDAWENSPDNQPVQKLVRANT